MSTFDRLCTISADATLTLREKHAALRAVDPTAAEMFARNNAAPLALEIRNAERAAERQAAHAAELKRIDQLPQPHLDTWEEIKRKDSVGASLYYQQHRMVIEAQREERRTIEAALSPNPPEAA
jgi:hypothetical protein